MSLGRRQIYCNFHLKHSKPTTPNSQIATINHERMPIILTEEGQFETWLKGKPQEAYHLLKQYPADAMRIVQQGAENVDKIETP